MAWVRKSDGWYWENEDFPKPQPEVVKNIIPVNPIEKEPEQEEPKEVIIEQKAIKPKSKKSKK